MLKENFRLKNDLAELGSFQERLSGLLESHGVGEELTHDVTLLAEELLVNTITHGYEEAPRLAEIEVELTIVPDSKVVLVFKDDASPFNPLEADERDLDEERLGGWGIPLLKTLADALEYQYTEGFNVFRFECGLRA